MPIAIPGGATNISGRRIGANWVRAGLVAEAPTPAVGER
jgi:hypothetical protein